MEASIPVVAFIAVGSPPQVLERHEISVEAADKTKQAIIKENWGEAFSYITPDMTEAFSISGTSEECLEKIA